MHGNSKGRINIAGVVGVTNTHVPVFSWFLRLGPCPRQNRARERGEREELLNIYRNGRERKEDERKNLWSLNKKQRMEKKKNYSCHVNKNT